MLCGREMVGWKEIAVFSEKLRLKRDRNYNLKMKSVWVIAFLIQIYNGIVKVGKNIFSAKQFLKSNNSTKKKLNLILHKKLTNMMHIKKASKNFYLTHCTAINALLAIKVVKFFHSSMWWWCAAGIWMKMAWGSLIGCAALITSNTWSCSVSVGGWLMVITIGVGTMAGGVIRQHSHSVIIWYSSVISQCSSVW